MQSNLTQDLFESVTKEEREERLKDPTRFVGRINDHLEEFGKDKNVSFLSVEEKTKINDLLVKLVECAKANPELKENWKIVYPVFLSTILSWIKISKGMNV